MSISMPIFLIILRIFSLSTVIGSGMLNFSITQSRELLRTDPSEP